MKTSVLIEIDTDAEFCGSDCSWKDVFPGRPRCTLFHRAIGYGSEGGWSRCDECLDADIAARYANIQGPDISKGTHGSNWRETIHAGRGVG